MDGIHILARMQDILTDLYSSGTALSILPEIKNLMDDYGKNEVIRKKRKKYGDQVILNEQDAFLITYADTIHKEGEKPLKTLHRFMQNYVKDALTGVHILPFFPSSSDGGYAVMDYKQVDPQFGDWEDVRQIAGEYRLAVDLVMNHMSSKSEWFQGFLQGDEKYRDYFIWRDEYVEMPDVFRPREHPLFTKFDTAMGEKYVWTTFSTDQVDLNYKNPEVLLKMIDVFLFYLSQGVEVIRLDAMGYVWKEPHTSCVNLPQAHELVKLLRRVLEYAAPYGALLVEANFPYRENVKYEVEGYEANMVYHFALPPLVVDAFARQDTSYIQEHTEKTRQDILFFDFLASHDGIGLLSAKEVLDKNVFDNLLRVTKAHNGLISYKQEDGTKSPYELNISYFDAINDPNRKDDTLAIKRFIASQAIMLSLKGIPGIYIHSLLGSRNNYQGLKKTGEARMINRGKLDEKRMDENLSDPRSVRFQVINKLLFLLDVRKDIKAFHPSSAREVIDEDDRLLVVVRQYHDETICSVINVSDDQVLLPEYQGRLDIITNSVFDGAVEPCGVLFLK